MGNKLYTKEREDERYSLAKDESGHWFIYPYERVEEVSEYLEYWDHPRPDDKEPPEMPDCMQMISSNKATSITFKKPETKR